MTLLLLTLPVWADPPGWVSRQVTLKNQDHQARIVYPVVEKGSPKPVLEELNRTLALKAAVGTSLEQFQADYRESWWLTEVSYRVLFQSPRLVSLVYTVAGCGAYPSESRHFLTVDLATGRRVGEAAFIPGQVPKLRKHLGDLIRADIQAACLENPEGADDIRQRCAQFSAQDVALDRLTVSDKGMTFYLDYGFPHVALALQPSGQFFVSREQARSWVASSGPLGPWAAHP